LFVGHEDTIGMEVELDLVDPLGRPRLTRISTQLVRGNLVN
jgi:hypothetical protein